MRIAFFTDTYLPNRDGVITSMLNSRQYLTAHGHTVAIVGPDRHTPPEPHGYFYRGIGLPFYPDYQIVIPPSVECIRSFQPDIIHTHGMGGIGIAALRAARTLNVPLVGTFHTHIPQAMHYYAPPFLRSIGATVVWSYCRWYFNHCDVVIAPSEVIRTDLVHHGFQRVVVLPNGVDTTTFVHQGKPREEKILSVGRVAKEKNLGVVIRALPKIREERPDIRFVIVGRGPALSEYRSLVSQLHLDDAVAFKNTFIPTEELVNEYNTARVFVFPSKFETQGLVALEAMACGTPVAGADYLAVKEYVKNGFNGYLFDPDDPSDCAAKILRTCEEYDQLSSGAVQTAMQFSSEMMSKKLEALYADLIDEYQRRARG